MKTLCAACVGDNRQPHLYQALKTDPDTALKSGRRESNPHHQLGRLELYH